MTPLLWNIVVVFRAKKFRLFWKTAYVRRLHAFCNSVSYTRKAERNLFIYMEAHQLCSKTNLDCWSYPYETNSFELINLENVGWSSHACPYRHRRHLLSRIMQIFWGLLTMRLLPMRIRYKPSIKSIVGIGALNNPPGINNCRWRTKRDNNSLYKVKVGRAVREMPTGAFLSPNERER